jgi:hypothetical protein
MATAAASSRGDAGPGWIATLLGVIVLVAGGFLAGLLVGIVGQEPELVAGHLAGRSEVVDWSPEPLHPLAREEMGLPSVSAGNEFDADPDFVRAAPEGLGEETPLRVVPPAFEPTLREAPPVEVGFSVQVGAFGDGLAAESLAESLQAKGYAAYVTPSAGNSAQRWRVRVGPIETRAEADTIARRLKSDERLPTWVSSH